MQAVFENQKKDDDLKKTMVLSNCQCYYGGATLMGSKTRLFCKESFVVLFTSLDRPPCPRLLFSLIIKAPCMASQDHIASKWLNNVSVSQLVFAFPVDLNWVRLLVSVIQTRWCVSHCLLVQSRCTRTFSRHHKTENHFCLASFWEVEVWLIHNRWNNSRSILGGHVF